MGVNDIFNIGASGIAAYRLGVEVTSENMTNVNTPGYSRQVTIFETGNTTTSRGFALGSGVNVAAVQRSYDSLLQRQIVDGNSSYQQALTRQKSMEQVEPLFNELTTNGIGNAVQKFFGAWQDLSINPSGAPERQSLMARAQILVDAFRRTNASLQNVRSFADNSLTGITADISDKAKNIASLNQQILVTERQGVNANELRDQRDLLVQQLGQKMGISYTENTDGTVTVRLPTTSAGGGQTLVDHGQYATVYADNAGGTTLNNIYITAIGTPPPATNPAVDTMVTATIGGPNDPTKAPDNSLGQIGGVLYVRNTLVPGVLANVDELAYNLSNQVNTQHAAGFGLNSATGNNFFTPAAPGPLPAAPAAFANYSANIDINNTLKTNLDAIAAANVDPAVGGRANNKVALAIAGLQSTPVSFTSGSSTLGSYYNALVSTVGVKKQDAVNVATHGESYLRQLNSLRESNSGVSLDEELTNLVKYQKAFEGSSRLISTATQMMDTILGLVR